MPVPNPTGAPPARPVFRTVRKDTGEVITPRQVVLARNGDPFTFAYATRPTTADKSGKVFVTDARGISQELYAHIFGLTVTRVIPCATVGCNRQATHTLTYSFPESRSESGGGEVA